MTNDRVAQALSDVLDLEADVRRWWQASGDDLAERDAALIVGRHATALRKALEGWLARRELRRALQEKELAHGG